MVGMSGKAGEGFKSKYQPGIEYLYYAFMNRIRHYYTLRETGMDIIGVRYEDLRDGPERMIPKLLDLAGIPAQYINKASEAMDKDSQEQSPFSRAKLAPFKAKYRAKYYPTQELVDHVQAQYDAAGIAGPKELAKKTFRLPGTIAP